MHKGYIQVYTGKGKGKTTAALGLALRAAGAGFRVYVSQFIKRRTCSEHKIIRDRLGDLITIKQFGQGLLMGRDVSPQDIAAARKGLSEIKKAIASGEYNVVILDEATIAVRYNLISREDLIEIMATKPEGLELVITGRYAEDSVIEKADLVTEMKEIKHYKEKGVKARRGIEC